MNNAFKGKELFLEDDSMIVTETNEKGIITFVSEDFCRFAEYTKEELIGQPHNIVRNDFMPKAAFADLWKTVQNKQKWNGIVVNKTKNNNYYWVKAFVYPSQYKDGSIKYISVRVKPTQEEIAHAINLYPNI